MKKKKQSDSASIWGEDAKYFYELDPDSILAAIDNLGLKTTGRILPLNSMENRVYDIECADRSVVAKFYRPGRWSKDQIKEEHEFLSDLVDQEIKVSAPLVFQGETLFTVANKNIFFSLFLKRGGRLKDELNDDEIVRLGHTIARLHQVGRNKKANHRLTLTPENYIKSNVEYLLSSGKIPKYLEDEYQSLTTKIFLEAQDLFKNVHLQRIHGDCHFGNILWRDDEFFLVDFDDMVMGPVVQDLWPMIPADDSESISKRALLWDAYNEIAPLPAHEIKLVPYLRAMRVINYAAWIAKRFEDPAFQNAFVNFGTDSYWKEQIQILREISVQTHQPEEEKVYINLDDEPWTPPIDWPSDDKDDD